MATTNKAPSKKRKLEGQYANYFQVGHNAFEFVIDFGQYYPGNDGAELFARIVTNPVYAKSLWDTLSTCIEEHEKAFGPIDFRD
jgi:hypothetical protein